MLSEVKYFSNSKPCDILNSGWCVNSCYLIPSLSFGRCWGILRIYEILVHVKNMRYDFQFWKTWPGIPKLIDVLVGTICGGFAVFWSSRLGRMILALSQHGTLANIMQGWQINCSYFSIQFRQMVYIGSPASGIDGQDRAGIWFLDYHFGPEGLTIAEKTLNNFAERAIRLYEQEPLG